MFLTIRRNAMVLAVFLCMAAPAGAEELAYDNGELRGSLPDMTAGQAEAMRLTTAHPATLTSVRLRFSKEGPVQIHVWRDNGGLSADLAGDLIEPLELTAPADGWLEVDLPAAVEVGPEVNFHVGHILKEDDGPVLLVDTSEDSISRGRFWAYWADFDRNIWYSLGEIVGEVTIYRNYMVRAEVTYHDQVSNRSFTDVTDSSGFGRPRRVSAVDYDGDGDIDVLADGRLLRNDGGLFTDVSVETGIDGYEAVVGGVFADYDRDGDLDLFLFVNSCCDEAEANGVYDHLLRNDEGMFVDVTATAGTFDYWPNQSASWGDLNGDGYPELFLPGYQQPGTLPTGYKLFFNEGDGTFSTVPNPSMIGLEASQISRTVPWADYDRDGWLDLYVGAYRLQKNYLYRNESGRFAEVGEATGTVGIYTNGYYGHTIGAEWGDLDNDRDLDLVVMNLAHPRFLDFSDLSKIYLNPLGTGSEVFEDVREQTGVVYRETASEPALGDFDNDGDLDLFQTNIYVGYESNLYANRLQEEGNLRFEEVSYPTGARLDNGWGAVWADYDGDGDLDLMAQGLYRNDTAASGNWLKVHLVGGEGLDTHGLGATVTVQAGDLTVTRLVSAGKGVGNQNPFELHFGLGEVERYDSLTVNWLGGVVEDHPCGLVNQTLEIVSGQILPEPDGGCPGSADGGDGGEADGEPVDGSDGGESGADPDDAGDGCGCSGSGRSAGQLTIWLLAGCLVWRRRDKLRIG